jgi:hypothetical protein
VEALHLAIAMRGVGRRANVFNIVGGTKGIEGSAEFSTIVCTDATRVAKKLEDLFTDSISDGGTTLIIDKGKNAKLAKAADGTENVHGIGTIAQTNYQV